MCHKACLVENETNFPETHMISPSGGNCDMQAPQSIAEEKWKRIVGAISHLPLKGSRRRGRGGMLRLLVSVGLVASRLVKLVVDEQELYDMDAGRGSRMADLPELWFDQKVNHKACSNATFKQRYFMNHQFYKQGGPAFLFIGGEGQLNPKWAQQSLLSKAAEDHGGVVFALEHRYYGKSWPTPDFALANLRFLSSRQALADMASFMASVPMPRGGGERPRWIVAGGSYPGNLAAWVRAKYPHIVTGAIASSAPVLAKEDFFEYDQQVQRTLARYGGDACAQYYYDVVREIDAIFRSGDRSRIDQLKADFGCGGVNDDSFVDGLSYVSGTVQYNRDNAVTAYCGQLKLNGTVAEKLVDFARDFKRELGDSTCQEATDLGEARDIAPHPDNAMRQWLYQCCTEFGYWQTAPHAPLPTARSRLGDVAFFRKNYCRALFGDGGPTVPRIDRTNAYYLGANISTSNILFTNGELDPWRPLSVASPGLASFVIDGASHATDLGYPAAKDSPPVAQAKALSLQLIATWLAS